jgi:hypothetical protein
MMGQVIDIAKEAEKLKIKLVFDPNSMLSLIHKGNEALNQVQEDSGTGESFTYCTPNCFSGENTTHRFLVPKVIFMPLVGITESFEEGREARADRSIQEYPKNPVFFY